MYISRIEVGRKDPAEPRKPRNGSWPPLHGHRATFAHVGALWRPVTQVPPRNRPRHVATRWPTVRLPEWQRATLRLGTPGPVFGSETPAGTNASRETVSLCCPKFQAQVMSQFTHQNANGGVLAPPWPHWWPTPPCDRVGPATFLSPSLDSSGQPLRGAAGLEFPARSRLTVTPSNRVSQRKH